MELDTRLDRDRFTWMSRDLTPADRASMLVEVTAPSLPRPDRPAPTHLVVVLDRSGSMGGGRLDHAKRALCEIVDRFTPHDTFGLVTFDDHVDVVVPAGQVSDPDGIKRAIDSVEPRGSTDLAAGLMRGFKEARRLESTTGVRVLLISDGHANHGVTDPGVLGRRTAEFIAFGVTTSTLGIGLGYDEELLGAIAQQGAGNEYFAQEADTAAGAIGAECGELIGQRFLSCRLTVTLGNGVHTMRLLGEANTRHVGDVLQIELGNLAPGQTRSVVLQFDPKQAPKPGRRKVASVRVDYMLADDLTDHHVATTVWAQIAGPGDRPANINRDVATEVLFQFVQRDKRRATDALHAGDDDAARRRYTRALHTIRSHWATIPRDRRAEFERDIAFIEQALARIETGVLEDRLFVSKAMSVDIALNSRLRDRHRPSN